MTEELDKLIQLSRVKKPDWNQIDVLITNLTNYPDQNYLANEVLPLTRDPDSRVRDTSISILAVINPDSPDLIKVIITRANEMAASEPMIFPAGRAVTVLLRYQPGSQLLAFFKNRVKENNWRQELLDNITNPDFHKLIA